MDDPEKKAKESHLQVLKPIDEQMGEDGQIYTNCVWEVITEPFISLGSLAKPNKKILQFKYNVPPKKSTRGKHPFEFFFG